MAKNKGGAPINNNNAEIWTLENANEFCDSVLKVLETNKKLRTLGGACLAVGQYEQLINYLEDKFKVEFVSVKKAKEIVKDRLIEQGLNGDTNPALTIFVLKNNHNMTDKVQTDVTTNGKELNNTIKVDIVRPEDNEE